MMHRPMMTIKATGSVRKENVQHVEKVHRPAIQPYFTISKQQF
jgi:hypothetical protein